MDQYILQSTEGLAGFKKVADKEFINNVADIIARATAVINFRMLGDRR